MDYLLLLHPQILGQQYPNPQYYPQPLLYYGFPPQNPIHTLPTLTHIPLLTGRLDFTPWDSRIQLIHHSLGLIGHIASTGDPIDLLHPETLLSYPPRMTQGYSQQDLMAYHQWWDHNGIVEHVIMTRLSNLVCASLPPDNVSGECTACTIYKAICQLYSLHSFTDGLMIFNVLIALPCIPNCVQEFVIK